MTFPVKFLTRFVTIEGFSARTHEMLNLNLVQIKLALRAMHGGGMQQLRIKTAQDSSSVLRPPKQQLA